MKKVLTLLALFSLVLLVACEKPLTLDNIDLKEYFWNLDSFDTPKVLVYESDHGNHTIQNYFLYERTDSNKLTIKRFNEHFELVQLFEDSVGRDGVWLTEAKEQTVFRSEIEMTPVEIVEGKIFPFGDSDRQISFTTRHLVRRFSSYRTTSTSTVHFDTIQMRTIGGSEKPTIIARGQEVYSRDIVGRNGLEKLTSTSPVEIWYSKSIGLTRITVNTPDSIYFKDEIYSETIGLEEFDKRKREFQETRML